MENYTEQKRKVRMRLEESKGSSEKKITLGEIWKNGNTRNKEKKQRNKDKGRDVLCIVRLVKQKLGRRGRGKEFAEDGK